MVMRQAARLVVPGGPSTLSRAQWSPQNTRTFCQLYVDEIDKGNCPRGQMSKWGWKNLTEGYFKATELVHDNIIFGSRVRQLKKEWNDLWKLYHKETGLGRNADGSISASAEWWKTNDKDNKLKGTLPDYMDLLERMFLGVAKDVGKPLMLLAMQECMYVSDDDERRPYPSSIGSKRSYSRPKTHKDRLLVPTRGRSPKKEDERRHKELDRQSGQQDEATKKIWHERNQVREEEEE
ncbi:unnamed protein product [Miscanthus lutarioriparius]|uniref:Myb/SANT-like domain-containing protein n=1 Tax=Miscanthus lutarioriparius TaxID=422564 RepID=A0A811PBU5_9POAL|nr:unnamed protein product [Miscanthus lutarioriparius]